MVQTRLDQAGEALAVQRHARGDQIAIEPGGGSVAHQLLEIAPGGGLAAGEVDLQGAEGRGLVDDALPDRGAQLLAGGGKLQRIGAIGALQGAAVGQLGQDRQGRGQGFVHLPFPDGVFAHIRTIPFWVSSPTRAWTSAAMVSRGAS